MKYVVFAVDVFLLAVFFIAVFFFVGLVLPT